MLKKKDKADGKGGIGDMIGEGLKKFGGAAAGAMPKPAMPMPSMKPPTGVMPMKPPMTPPVSGTPPIYQKPKPVAPAAPTPPDQMKKNPLRRFRQRNHDRQRGPRFMAMRGAMDRAGGDRDGDES